MKCIKCKAISKIEIKGTGKFCKKCFLDMIIKRIKKDIRQLNLKKNSKIILVKETTPSFLLSKYVLENLELPIKLEIKKEIEIKRKNNIIYPKSMDDIAEEFFQNIIQNKKTRKTISILKNISDFEIKKFADFMGWKYKKYKKNILLDKLEKKYPNIKFALLKSMEKIQNIL